MDPQDEIRKIVEIFQVKANPLDLKLKLEFIADGL